MTALENLLADYRRLAFPEDDEPTDALRRERVAAALAEQAELVAALRELAECSPCQNGCAPDDMTCASRRAAAVLSRFPNVTP